MKINKMLISDGVNHGKLQSIIVGELKKAGLKHRLKKIILKNVKDHKAVFGAPLAKVPSCSVICCGSNLSVPIIVNEMSSVLRSNAHIEGLFRKAGSQTRQKDIKRLLDAGGCVSEGHHPIDVASVLKLYLRCLPEPLISAEVQDLLLRCRITAGDDALTPILHTLLLLPVLHVHLLHYIMELLNYIASRHKDNLMDASNLAIVMAPSIMPLPAASSAQRLEHHVALVKLFIENSKHIGLLTEDLMNQLEDDSDNFSARRKKRRSGSFNRMLSGLRKIVSGNVNTPATVRENENTPILTKSASKRKFDNYDGLSAKTRLILPLHVQMMNAILFGAVRKPESLSPTTDSLRLHIKCETIRGLERKRLRLSLIDARSTPVINSDFSSQKNSETSISSEDVLTSSEHLFNPHDTIDLSPDMKKADRDYVRISKQEYEEIKSRVSAIENRLSREFTEVIPRVQPLQHVQNVYEQTLEEVAMLDYPNSDHLARRLSKELKIRPEEQGKIIRSPSARKIGTIRRRSKENVTKIVRHKSWNVSSQSQTSQNMDRFYPYMGLSRNISKRERTSTKPERIIAKLKSPEWETSASDSSTNNISSNSIKYHLRRRVSLASDCNLNKTIGKMRPRRSLNVLTNNNNSWDASASESSMNNTSNTSEKANEAIYQNYKDVKTKTPTQAQPKWRNAATFFMEKTGELENTSQTGRPSVNKLRRQNAGAVLAKAKLFESSSDKSSEQNEKSAQTGFARRPRQSLQNQIRNHKNVAFVKPKIQTPDQAPRVPVRINKNTEVSSNVPSRSCRPVTKEDLDIWRNRKNTSPLKKNLSPQNHVPFKATLSTPVLKKPLCTQRNVRTPVNNNDPRRLNTPMKAIHISPRRRSPRQKLHR